MSGPKEWIAETQAPDTEVELSAQDLLELAGPVEPKPEPKVTVAVPARARRNMPVSRLSLSAMLVVGGIAALALIMVLSEARQPSTQQFVQQATQPALPASQPETQIEGKPVLFVNPFDAREVFEFPAGTSAAEARDKVAQILMERAMERRNQWDTLVTKDH